MANSGEELLEPFRPRTRNHSRQTGKMVTDVNERLHRLSRSCSSRISWARRMGQSIGSETGDMAMQSSPSGGDAQHADCTTKQNGDAEEIEVNEYMQNVVSVVHNDELFRKLKEDMRKSARSGFGSQHVVQKFVDEHAKEHSTRQRSDNTVLLSVKNLRSPSLYESDTNLLGRDSIRNRSDRNVLSARGSNHSMKNIRPLQRSRTDLMGRDSMGQTLTKEDKREHLQDLKAKSVPDRQQLFADFKTSFRNNTGNLRSRIYTPPCA